MYLSSQLVKPNAGDSLEQDVIFKYKIQAFQLH